MIGQGQRDAHLDNLVLRLSKVCAGEHLFDVASAGAMLAAYAIGTAPVANRDEMLEMVIKFMRERVWLAEHEFDGPMQ